MWLAVDKDGTEFISFSKPFRKEFKTRWDIEEGSDAVDLPLDSIEKIIGRKLTWSDEPVEFVEKSKIEHEKEECWAIGIKDKNGDWGMNYGPCKVEEEVLNQTGEEDEYIIHFLDDQSVPTWKWDNNGWVKI
jgi:hypothetical protein